MSLLIVTLFDHCQQLKRVSRLASTIYPPIATHKHPTCLHIFKSILDIALEDTSRSLCYIALNAF